jgi:hypothetical protein
MHGLGPSAHPGGRGRKKGKRMSVSISQPKLKSDFPSSHLSFYCTIPLLVMPYDAPPAM